MGPVGRVPSNFLELGDQVYLVTSNFCDRLSFLLVSTLFNGWQTCSDGVHLPSVKKR